MLFVVRFLLLIGFAVAALSSAEARRVALVIGNSDYKVGPLQNPGKDAKAVADLLGKIGFNKVMLRLNLDIAGFRAALLEMSRESSAGAEVGLVYFAGHGTEVNGRNFLIPVDAKLAKSSDLDLEGISLDTVVNQLAGVSKLKLVILDACRNSIFPLAGAKRASTRGLARVEPEDNTLIAYAAKDGTTAADGVVGSQSPFTEALLKHMATPGLDVRLMLGKVRDHVLAATKRQQQPFAYGSLSGEVIALVPAVLTKSAQAVERATELGLFSVEDAKRVGAIAEKHGMPLPAVRLEFLVPRADVPSKMRAFVGVWAIEMGMDAGRGRKNLLIVTGVDEAGQADGYWAFGPPGPTSFSKTEPPAFYRILARIEGETLHFSLGSHSHKFTHMGGNRLRYVWSHKSGRTAADIFDPVWTLVAAERAAKR